MCLGMPRAPKPGAQPGPSSWGMRGASAQCLQAVQSQTKAQSPCRVPRLSEACDGRPLSLLGFALLTRTGQYPGGSSSQQTPHCGKQAFAKGTSTAPCLSSTTTHRKATLLTRSPTISKPLPKTHAGLTQRFQFDETKLADWLVIMEEGYGNNPYHWQVTASLHFPGSCCFLTQALCPALTPPTMHLLDCPPKHVAAVPAAAPSALPAHTASCHAPCVQQAACRGRTA